MAVRRCGGSPGWWSSSWWSPGVDGRRGDLALVGRHPVLWRCLGWGVGADCFLSSPSFVSAVGLTMLLLLLLPAMFDLVLSHRQLRQELLQSWTPRDASLTSGGANQSTTFNFQVSPLLFKNAYKKLNDIISNKKCNRVSRISLQVLLILT